MPISSKTATREGRQVTLTYTFADGTVRELRVRGDNDVLANELLLRHEPSVLASKQRADVDEAIAAGSDAVQPDATQVQIHKAWMTKGYQSKDPIESHMYLSKVAAKVIALGLTTAQLAAQFEEDIDTVEAVLAKWQYVNANKTTIQAYKIIKDGM